MESLEIIYIFNITLVTVVVKLGRLDGEPN